MKPYPKPSLIELNGDNPAHCGQNHGEAYRREIREIADIRISLMCKETQFQTENLVLELAKAHLPVLKNFDENLYLELIGIAEGSNLSPEHIVVLNHYTDLRDIQQQNFDQTNDDTKGCSMVYMPGENGPILGQTWDISGSLLDYVIILKINFSSAHLPRQMMLFSIPGCLGMTGMNSNHLGVCINNLNSTDAGIGIIWSALVRKILNQKNAKEGCTVVMNAPLGSGHHYSIADLKDFFGIETSGTKKKITQQGGGQFHFHTNHCLDEEMKNTNIVKKTSTTLIRYEKLKHELCEASNFLSAKIFFETLGVVSMPKTESNPDAVATCGAFVMDLKNGFALTCKGPPSSRFNNPPHLVSF